MIATAREQMVVDALMVETQTGSASSTMAPPPKQRATKDQKPLKQGIGHQLARSQTQKQWPQEPETCLHPEDQLRMRGNQAKHWWVCLSCGSRWERTEAAVAVPGQGAVPEQVRPVYRATAPPKLLPPPRSRANLGSITLEQARTTPQGTGPGTSSGTRSAGATWRSAAVHNQAAAIPPKTSFAKKVNGPAYPDEMFVNEPDYQHMADQIEPNSGSSLMRAVTLFNPGSPVRDVERVDARRVMRTSPSEWADYHPANDVRSEGPMKGPRRSRSLPAGVVPTQERSRRRQVQLREGPTELYAINDSDQESSPDKTPGSFAMVENPEKDEL